MVFLGTIPWCSGRSVVHAWVPWFETFNGEQFGFRFHVHSNWMLIHLVGGLEHFFSIYWESEPQLTFIFFRGVETTNQSCLFMFLFSLFQDISYKQMIQSHSQIPRSLSVHRGTVLLGADEPHVPRRQRERERWQKVRWGATRLAKKMR